MDLAVVEEELKAAKKRLEDIYERRGKTDKDVLKAAREVDRLLNYLYTKFELQTSNDVERTSLSLSPGRGE